MASFVLINPHAEEVGNEINTTATAVVYTARPTARPASAAAILASYVRTSAPKKLRLKTGILNQVVLPKRTMSSSRIDTHGLEAVVAGSFGGFGLPVERGTQSHKHDACTTRQGAICKF